MTSIALHPLKLRAIGSEWQLFQKRNTDSKFANLKAQVLKRDSYICCFCGFQTKDQEIINLDHNYKNNRPNNLVTSCCFCAQCFFLEMVGLNDQGGGILIYLPRMSQNDLNGLCHVVFCAMANATNYRNEAQKIYNKLRLMSQILEKQLGEGLSNPAIMGQRLIDARMRNRSMVADKVLRDLRLLPSYKKFKPRIDQWAHSAFKELASVSSSK